MEWLNTPITVGGLLGAFVIHVVYHVCKVLWDRGETPKEEE